MQKNDIDPPIKVPHKYDPVSRLNNLKNDLLCARVRGIVFFKQAVADLLCVRIIVRRRGGNTNNSAFFMTFWFQRTDTAAPAGLTIVTSIHA